MVKKKYFLNWIKQVVNQFTAKFNILMVGFLTIFKLFNISTVLYQQKKKNCLSNGTLSYLVGKNKLVVMICVVCCDISYIYLYFTKLKCFSLE